MESYCSLCTVKIPQGANNLILCTLDTIHRLFFVTRLIINKSNKVQWVDFKLENVLVSLHSLKTMGLSSIIFKEWRVTWTFSYTYIQTYLVFIYTIYNGIKTHNINIRGVLPQNEVYSNMLKNLQRRPYGRGSGGRIRPPEALG